MTTVTVTRGIAWATAHCVWCGRPQPFRVQGAGGQLTRFTCYHRKCLLDNEVLLR